MQEPTGNGANPAEGQIEKIDSRCIVKFRPDDNWRGEYGFDWFREGDGDIQEWIDGTKTSSNYNNIVGKYRFDDPDSSNYDKNVDRLVPTKNNIDFRTRLGESYGTTKILTPNASAPSKNYYVPVIHLFYMSSNPWNSDDEKNPPKIMRSSRRRNTIHSFCTTTAKIKLLIHAQNIERIGLEYEGCISVSVNNSVNKSPSINQTLKTFISPISNGNSEKIITVALKYDFEDKYKYIKAYAYHKDGKTRTFAGLIKIKRCIPKTIKICFVNVIFKLKNSRTILSCKDDKHNNYLEKKKSMLCRYFSQACIIPKIESVEMDMSENTHELNKHWVQDGHGKWLLHIDDTNGQVITDKLLRLFNRIRDGEDKPEYGKKYKRYYKCFFLGAEGAYGARNNLETGLLGAARGIPSMECVLFENHSYSATTCHELIHCLGFYHIFNNMSSFTFEKKKTSNIMDYGATRYTLWHWQWKEIRKKIEEIENNNG